MRQALATVLLFGAFAVAHADEPPVPPEIPRGADSVGRVRLVRDPGGHTAVPRRLTFTPDGKKLISAGDDRTIQVWDVATRERLRVIRGPMGVDGQGGVALIGHNPLPMDRKGERVAFCVEAKDDSGKAVRTTFVCSLETGRAQVLKHFGSHEFTPDGAALAFAEQHNINVVKIDGDLLLQTVKVPSKDNVMNVAYSPDGKTLAVVAGDAKVYLFDAAKLEPKSTLTVPGSGNNLRNVVWVDNKTVVCRSWSEGKTVVVLDAVKGELKYSYSKKDLLSHLPEEKKALEQIIEIDPVVGTTKVLIRTKYQEATLKHWPNANYLLDWATGQADPTYRQHSWFGCEAAAVAPDLSIGAQGDGNLNDIILWDPKVGKALPDGKDVRRLRASTRGAKGGIECIRWRPDGNGIVWIQMREVPGSDLGYREMDLTALTVTPVSWGIWDQYSKANAKLVLGDNQQPDVWQKKEQNPERGIRRTDGSLTIKYNGERPPEVIGDGQTVTLKGTWSVCGWDFTVVPQGAVAYHPWTSNLTEIFDGRTGQRLHSSRPTQSYITSWAVSPKLERPYLLIGSADQTLTIYNTATGKVILTVYPTRTDWIAWTPEGYYAASLGGERLMGWHVENGPDQLASFYPAERFRKQLYRPDVIKLVLEKGSVEEALQVANAALKKEGVAVPDGVAKLAKLLPPTVTLSIADKSKLPTVKLKVSAKAGAAEQPIKALRLFVDGRPLNDKNVSTTFERGVPKDEREWTVELPDGNHRVMVLARSADASGMSNEVEIDCRPAKDKPVLHVLAVGVSVYQDKALNLGCADNDATLLAKTFKSQSEGPLFGEVRPTVLLNKDATAQAVRAAINKLRTDPEAKAKANDLVIVFFAGHGAKEKDQFYLLTHDANVNNLAKTALSGKELREALGAFPCQVLLMMDACHSGAFGAKGKLAAQNLKPATDEATRTFTDDEVGIAVMCAAMGNETAAERKNNGLFTEAIVAALTASKDVPYNRVNHRQYIHHLQAYVFDTVSVASQEKQHPFLHLPWVVESFPLRNLPAK
jgi:WD40 repeat protein